MRNLRICVFLFLMAFMSFCASGQNHVVKDSSQVQLTMKDGNVIKGLMTVIDEDTVMINTSSGEINVHLHMIGNIKYIDSDDKKYIMLLHANNPAASHNYITSSGYGLKKGEAYYLNSYILFNSYHRGITDNFSIGIGGELVSLLFASRFPVLFVSPKFSFPMKNGKGAFSISGTLFTSPADEFEGFGFVSSAITLGNIADNITLSSGLGFSTSNGFVDDFVPIIISGQKRLNRKWGLVSENWFVFSNDGDFGSVISLSARINSSGGNYFSFGLMRPLTDIDNFIAFPIISGMVKF